MPLTQNEQRTKYKAQRTKPTKITTRHENLRVQQFDITLNLPQEIGESLSLYV